MNANFATYTTTKMVRENNAYLALDNGVGVLGSNNSYSVPETSSEITLKNVMIPINQLVPLFMDVCSEGFPVRCLKSQIEFRLYIAEPYRYLVDWDPTVKDFSSTFFNPTGTANTNENAKIKNRFSPTSIKLSNVKMYCAHYVPNPNEAAPIDEKCNVGSGMKYKYSMIQTALRQVDKIARSNNLPFSVTTNNTKSLMLYCHETEKSPTLMYRPNINSLYIKFGSNQLPFQPIAGSSFDTPFEYKFTSDDVLDSIDTYFSETNFDYNYSYKYIPNTSSKPDSINVPTSTFVLMGSNYVSDPSALGSESSRWNSQYQASFNAPYEDPTKLTFVLAVASEYGLIVKDGKIITVNV